MRSNSADTSVHGEGPEGVAFRIQVHRDPSVDSAGRVHRINLAQSLIAFRWASRIASMDRKLSGPAPAGLA
jgi:hypothetical protein